jgi:tRNA nucleotidyltransferase/poly(A) polymerase
MKHETSVALMKFLSAVARQLSVAEHVYVVGGAVRNFVIQQPIKDLDVVIDMIALGGKDSEWFANQLRKAVPTDTSLVTNQYGVTILTIKGDWVVGTENLKGEVIEIANARKESYGGEGGKSYKPHMVEPATIEEDLYRREFSFNTLLWRLHDLADGPDKAEILDLTGLGRKDLENRILRTPVDPDKTFGDDPTRMLRAIKFVAKYGFNIPADIEGSIRRNAPKLKSMPWNAVWKILVDDILGGPAPRASVALLQSLGLADVLREMIQEESGMAAALSRSLNEREAHVLLDLLDLGWAVRTPVSFLDKAGQARLREVLLSNSDDFGKGFVEALKKPPVNQQRLFTEYQILPKERSSVIQIAREALLLNPELSTDPRSLEGVVEDKIKNRFQKTAAIRVVERFLHVK